MAIQHSTGLRNYLLASGIASAFDTNGRIAIYTGTKPTADAAATGTLLATLTLSTDAMGTPANGAVAFNTITQDSDVDASGTPGYFIIYNTTETALTSAAGTSDKRLMGDITVTSGGGDITYDSVSWAQHGIATLSSLTYTAPV